MGKMDPDELDIDDGLVRKLIAEQFPQVAWAIENLEKEWLRIPMIARFLSLAIPVPIRKGSPTKEYPRPCPVFASSARD